MQYRSLGRTGLRVSVLAFGAGPVPALMTGNDRESQRAVIGRAVAAGINWFDTAPGYGQGESETNLGLALRALNPPGQVHLATKVRLAGNQLDDVVWSVRRSVEESLDRLGVEAVTLLQLHNGITAGRDDEPMSITPADVLATHGVLRAFERLRADGLVRYFGLTATGHPAALREVIHSGAFDTVQVPYHVLNPSAGRTMPDGLTETNYGNLIADCSVHDMGVFAIRVYAGGALLGSAPSAHTLKTPFFPLELYERDRRRAAALTARLGGCSLKETAVRFALSHDSIHSAIIGFGAPEHVDEAVALAEAGPLSPEFLERLLVTL